MFCLEIPVLVATSVVVEAEHVRTSRQKYQLFITTDTTGDYPELTDAETSVPHTKYLLVSQMLKHSLEQWSVAWQFS